MIPLLICSLFAVAFIMERFIFWFRTNRSRDKKLVAAILDMCDAGKFEEAYQKGKESKDFVAYVLLNGIAHRAYSMEGAMEAASERIIKDMSKNLMILETLITLSPLLGIFGTVTGIIFSFDMLGKMGVEAPRVVSLGIAQALITTAFGLAIAMPTLIFYNYFVSRVTHAAKEVEKNANILSLIEDRRTFEGGRKRESREVIP
jgi:biopolymer transport protein ExbB